jgi:hypothetical protein
VEDGRSYAGINLTPSCSVIEVSKVLVPGALIANGTSQKQSLESYGPPPFHLVCLHNHLCHSLPDTESSHPFPILLPNPGPKSSTSAQSMVSDEAIQDAGGGSGFGDLLAKVCQSETDPIHQNINDHVPDPASQAEGEHLLGGITLDGWVKII